MILIGCREAFEVLTRFDPGLREAVQRQILMEWADDR